MSNAVTPTPSTERIDALDALRGFALAGIFLANIQDWSTWSWMGEASQVALAGEAVARFVDFFHLAFVDGKFYTIFSFLFGMGFALQFTRLEERGENGMRIYRRRLALLLLMGLAHMSLLWAGDILTVYALLGFVLVLFRDVSDRRILAIATALILLPIPGYALVRWLGIPPDLGFFERSLALANHLWALWVGGTPPPELEWYGSPDWGAYWSWTLGGPPWRLGALLDSWRFPKVLGIMMLGLWAGRRLVAGSLLSDTRLLKRVAVAGFVVGVPANLGYAAIGGLGHEDFATGLAATALYAFGVVPLALGYAAAFGLAWPRAHRVLGVAAPAGRMALTNYLSQTLLGMAIFQGVGLGLAGSVGPGVIFSVAIAILAAQAVLSTLWLSRFRQGPMEWLWRRGTYGAR